MIHYHGTPGSGKRIDIPDFLRARHALIPFPRPDDISIAAEVCQSFILDNGAFSAWRAGSPVDDWTDYYSWVGAWKYHPGFDWAIIPDVIDGTEEENDSLLEEWPHGIHLGVPVWHFDESLERLEYLASRWPRVALGSSGKYAKVGTPEWWVRAREVFSRICNRDGYPIVKLHGLRMLSSKIITKLPLSSGDSTNAARHPNRVISKLKGYVLPTRGVSMAIIAANIENQTAASVFVR